MYQDSKRPQEKYKALTFRIPYNSVSQIYDYKSGVSRIVYGPKLVILGPSEELTLNDISGSTPKIQK